jgi:transposase
MWTEITRPKYERAGQRYASDLTDAEWAVIEPSMPARRAFGAAARDRLARSAGRDLVYRTDRLPMAHAPSSRFPQWAFMRSSKESALR